jgi:hypothetical protein
MVWPESLAVLTAVGVVTRRLLGLTGTGPKTGLPLSGDRERFYRSVTLELDAQTAILAVSLNDAMEERACGHLELARSTLRLTAAQWNRQAETLALVLSAMTSHLPMARVSQPSRALVPEYFKSKAMQGYLGMHDRADQFVFRNKPRFSLHLRALEHAVATLTVDFLEAQRGTHGDATLWARLDDDFHDFDLLTKETLLALRTFMAGLPPKALESFASEVQPALRHGVRASSEEHWDA